MAPEDACRSPGAQSSSDSFDLHRDEYGQKIDPDIYLRSRSRNRSNVRPNNNGVHHHPAPPVDDAVNNAFERSDAASQVDPSLVAQITEQVINTLKASGITGVQQQVPQQQTQTRIRAGNSRSPTNSTAASLPRRYTPPSPTRQDAPSYRSSSPEPQFSEPASFTSSYDMPRPNRGSDNASPARAPDDARPRPRQMRVPSAVEETTTLEKIWEPLFSLGQPTPRLSQFLRGLALHIIDHYEPKRSLVIPPWKMCQFFEDVKLPNEVYPWRDIFGGRITNESLSRMYRDLRCQHHFIQLGIHHTPEVPALTPEGFDCLMTMLIQAHPGTEFERLAKAVLDMPISNADDSKERFPKELSRRLFPAEDDIQQQQRLHAAISADRNIQLRNSNPMPPPPSTQPPPSSQPSSAPFAERERAPYSNPSSTFDDEDLRPAPVQIERERKPYTAKEGGGKIFEDERKNPFRTDPATRTSRANSAAPAQPPFTTQSRPTDIPATGSRHHRFSGTGGQRPAMNTPPTHNPYTRSEGTNIAEVPASYYSSNLYPNEDDRNRYTRKDDDSRRASWVPQRGYDYGSTYDERRRTMGGTDGYGSTYNGYPPTSRY